jgi:DNA-nicking Smr family endonuclease
VTPLRCLAPETTVSAPEETVPFDSPSERKDRMAPQTASRPLLKRAARQPGVPAVTPDEPPAPRMDRKRYEKMRRGRLDPDARIDLHGMTAERAHAALNGFIARAHASGLRLVLIITGKGRATDGFMAGDREQGILRRSVPHWLAMPPNHLRILHLTAAHRRHGGEGAFYVYLARSGRRSS